MNRPLRSALEPAPSGGPRPRLLGALVPNPTGPGDGVAGLSGRWVLPGTGRTRRVDALALALVGRITRRPQAVRRLESRSRTGFRSARLAWRSGSLASAVWSDAPARALSEFDRTLLYGLGSRADRQRGGAHRRSCPCCSAGPPRRSPRSPSPGLLTRLLPDTFPISGGFLPERVSFPLTYWNAMGIACAARRRC